MTWWQNVQDALWTIGALAGLGWFVIHKMEQKNPGLKERIKNFFLPKSIPERQDFFEEEIKVSSQKRRKL